LRRRSTGRRKRRWRPPSASDIDPTDADRIPDELRGVVHAYTGIADERDRRRLLRLWEASVEVYGTEPPEELAEG
jgi:hypothetical protein